MRRITFVTGGGRSGKSAYALSLARRYQGSKVFIATAAPCDDEMRTRIRKHQEERGSGFRTIEEMRDPGRAVQSHAADVEIIVIDCLTVWLGNLMHEDMHAIEDCPEIVRFLDVLKEPPCDLIIVSNEVGMGIVPLNAMARRFRDMAGRLNQQVAARAGRVVLMVSGIPVIVKEEGL